MLQAFRFGALTWARLEVGTQVVRKGLRGGGRGMNRASGRAASDQRGEVRRVYSAHLLIFNGKVGLF